MSNLFNELKRRNVFKVGAVYVVVGWVILQIADIIAPLMSLPETVSKYLLFLLIVLLPLVLFLAWVFDLKPTGGEGAAKDTAVKSAVPLVVSIMLIGGLGYYTLLHEPSLVNEPNKIIESEPTPAINRASIAVLAFADLSPAGDQEYFGDGISESLLNVLAKIEELSVSSRTSSFAFKGENRNVTDIADILNVAHILEGSVKKAGNRVLITAQLIDAAENRHLWSDTYERELTTENIFAIQAEIATAIVEALSEELGIGLKADTKIDPLTANMSAYDLYLQAQNEGEIRTVESTYRRVALLERAVELDPTFAEAWALYGSLIGSLSSWDHSLDIQTYRKKAIIAAERALEINPKIERAYDTLVVAYFVLNQWEKGLGVITRAQKYLPEFDMLHSEKMGLGYLKVAFDDAAAETKTLYGDGFTYAIQALYYEALGQNDRAIEMYTIAMQKGYNGPVQDNLAEIYWSRGDTSLWTSYYTREFQDKDPELLPFIPHLVDLSKGIDANSPEAVTRFRAVAREMGFEISDFLKPSPRWGWGLRVPNKIALALGGAEKIVDNYWTNHPKFWMWTQYLYDFRQTDAWRSRVRSSGMLAYWQKHGWPDLCRQKGTDDFVCD